MSIKITKILILMFFSNNSNNRLDTSSVDRFVGRRKTFESCTLLFDVSIEQNKTANFLILILANRLWYPWLEKRFQTKSLGLRLMVFTRLWASLKIEFTRHFTLKWSRRTKVTYFIISGFFDFTNFLPSFVYFF